MTPSNPISGRMNSDAPRTASTTRSAGGRRIGSDPAESGVDEDRLALRRFDERRRSGARSSRSSVSLTTAIGYSARTSTPAGSGTTRSRSGIARASVAYTRPASSSPAASFPASERTSGSSVSIDASTPASSSTWRAYRPHGTCGAHTPTRRAGSASASRPSTSPGSSWGPRAPSSSWRIASVFDEARIEQCVHRHRRGERDDIGGGALLDLDAERTAAGDADLDVDVRVRLLERDFHRLEGVGERRRGQHEERVRVVIRSASGHGPRRHRDEDAGDPEHAGPNLVERRPRSVHAGRSIPPGSTRPPRMWQHRWRNTRCVVDLGDFVKIPDHWSSWHRRCPKSSS